MVPFRRALVLLCMAAACAANAGPTAYSWANPAPGPGGWNTTNVDVFLQASLLAQGSPSVSSFTAGAQVGPLRTVQGFTATVPVRAEGETRVTFFASDDTGDGGWHFHDVRIDRTPPRSAASIRLRPDGSGYDITLKADDVPGSSAPTSSGVREIRVNLDNFGETFVSGSTANVVLPVTGWNRLVFYAVDAAGNEEYPYQVLTREGGLQVAPGRVEITGPVGGIAFAPMTVEQTNLLFPVDVLAMWTDSPYFKPDGSCILPMAGVLRCYFSVAFFPPAAFDYSGTLYVQTTDPLQPIVTVELHGRGAYPGVRFTPDPVAFPITTVGATSAPLTVTIANDGTVPLVLAGVTTTPGAFAIVDDRCNTATLAPFARCEVDVAFTPVAGGLHPGSLEVQSNLPGPARTVPFEAFGLLPTQLAALPAGVDFGDVAIGDYAKASVEIVNDGGAPYYVRDFTITGTGAAMYVVARAACTNGFAPTSIEPKQVCTIDLLYRPTLPGTHDAVLRARSSMGQPDFDVPLTGTAP